MPPPAAPPRKRTPGPKPAKVAPDGTIRVAKVIAPLPSPVPTAAGPEVKEELAPGLPCSGRCGHCDHHPCRLHGGI